MNARVTVTALRGSPLLEGVPEEALERLHAQGQEIDLPAGVSLMEEGEEPDAMYVLLEGELDVQKRVGSDEITVGTVGEGELVGELGLLHGRPRSVSLRAVRPCRLLRIPGEALDELLSHPRSARALLATATRRLEQQELLVVQHGRMAALGSLTAGLLHELNNPAAAVRRAADQLAEAIEIFREADRALAASAPADVAAMLADAAKRRGLPPDPLARADAEEQCRAWLQSQGVPTPWKLSGALAAAAVDVSDLETLTHDLDGPAIEAAARWLAARVELDRLLEEAGTGAGRISEIVSAVKSFSHHDEAPVQDVEVHEGLESALTLLRHKMGGVRVLRAFAEDLPRIEGYPGDLNVVWTNLIDNAVDAVGSSGTITLATRVEPEHVVVEVTDDGPGIPADIADRVFDPFFTTKPVGQGTGIGLATSHAIVRERHHGAIDVDSRPGRTTVTVRLPRRREASEPDPTTEHEPAGGDSADKTDHDPAGG